jgi:hypothetical protein
MSIEEMFLEYHLGLYRQSKNAHGDIHSTIAKIGQALSSSKNQHVVIIDEQRHIQDYRMLATYANVDMVILAKANENGENDIIPPASDKNLRVHDLSNSYRQGWDTFMAHKYMMTHAMGRFGYTLSTAAAMVPDNEGRCPVGGTTVWINCQKDVKEATALERVKEVLDVKKKRTGRAEEGNHVTVLVRSFDATPETRKFCAEQGWTCAEGWTTIHGYEDDVICIHIDGTT